MFVRVLDQRFFMTNHFAPTPKPLQPKIVRVLLVDNSPMALSLERKMLATSPHIEVVGTAANGREGLQLLPELRADVVCTDDQMPVMNGLELVRQIMATTPCPILIVSSRARDDVSRGELLPLLAAGALDVFPKPTATQNFEETARAFVEKIRVLAGVYVFSRRSEPMTIPAMTTSAATTSAVTTPRAALPNIEYSMSNNKTKATFQSADKKGEMLSLSGVRVVAIGASTGGPQVLQTILRQLPVDFPCPVLCVQHISAGFLSGLVEWLDASCRLRVKIMEEGETARAGTVYFPRESRHMTMDARGVLSSSGAPTVDGHRPSVTALFRSLAQNDGKTVLAILLTGMGEDGARGLQEVYESGGKTIAQNEASSVVFGMPRKAIEAGAAQHVLSDVEIAQFLARKI